MPMAKTKLYKYTTHTSCSFSFFMVSATKAWLIAPPILTHALGSIAKSTRPVELHNSLSLDNVSRDKSSIKFPRITIAIPIVVIRSNTLTLD